MKKFDNSYLEMASVWARNSYCKRRQVGALLVKDRMIISDGDNLAIRLLNTLSVNPQKLFADTLVAMGENLEEYKEQIKATVRGADNGQGMLIERYSRDLTALAAEGKLDPEKLKELKKLKA